MKTKITQAFVERIRSRRAEAAPTPTRSFGDHPTLAKEAREAARQRLASMKAGIDPNEEKRRARARGLTLRQALELHIAAKERSPVTVQGYRYQIKQYLADWLDKPLMEIGTDRTGVRERHRRITERHGGTSADLTMRVLRTVYNRGLREHPDLPPNPCKNVDFHGIMRREVHTNARQLREWGAAVLTLSPIKRDLNLFMLLTGMRRTATIEARIEHFDEARGCLRVPNPKGGERRAFDLALALPLIDLIRRRIGENRKLYPDSPWLFPANSGSGHVAEIRDASLGNLVGHALRHVYATLALEAGVPIAELKFLPTHAVSRRRDDGLPAPPPWSTSPSGRIRPRRASCRRSAYPGSSRKEIRRGRLLRVPVEPD